MKKRRFTWLAAASAGVLLLGASAAFADHPKVDLDNDGTAESNIPLYTFEEVSEQYDMSGKMPVMVMDETTMQGMPYSIKQSCNECHDYDAISKHSFHSGLGMYQWSDTADGEFDTTQSRPWTQGAGMYGKW